MASLVIPPPSLAAPAHTDTRGALRVGALAALLKLATALPVLTRYGWDRDELYYVAAARHLAAGYVDFPAVTALVARLVITLAGPSLFALRLTGVVAGMGVVVMVALCTAELGGGRRAQILATGLLVASPYGLCLGMLLHPTMFDAFTWSLVVYLALRILGRPQPGLWPVLGAVAGLALEVKGTSAALLIALLAGCAAFSGRRLRDRGVLWAVGIALAIWSPEIVWEVAHGWPTLAFLPSQDAVTAASASRSAYLAQQILFLGGALPLAVLGTRWLWRHGRRELAVVAPLVDVLFWCGRGRCYYALPAMILPLAAGAVALEGWWPAAARRSRRAAVTAVLALSIAGLGLGAVVVWPVLPTSAMIHLGVWRQSFYGDEIGWPALVRQTASAWRALPASRRSHTIILAENYGEAGALDLWGPRAGLPPALSGHLSFQYWRPRALPQRSLLTVGFSTERLASMCVSFTVVGHIHNRWRLDNEEEGQPIAVCRLHRPLGRIWSRQIATDHL